MHYKDFGYDEYDDYLVGPEWRGLKRYFYENRDSYTCTVCGTHQGLVLHKRSYKFLALVELKRKYRGDQTKIMRYLHTYMCYLCRGCNKKVHFYPNGERVPLEYRKLKDRELQVLRAARALHSSPGKPPQGSSKRAGQFLGSYFNRLLKR
jgi:5-methylcytosine-specific restriction endonuclease McrA